MVDLSWVIDTDEMTPEIEPITNVFVSTCINLAFTASELTAECAYGTESIDINTALNLDALGDLQVLPATPFVATHVLNFLGIGGTANAITLSSVNLGEWELNGFQAFVPYMPYGPGIGQVIYIVNRGPQAGDIDRRG